MEHEVEGGRIDVVLRKKDIHIAIEISLTNTPDYEVKNITKCLNAGYPLVLMISEDRKHLTAIQKKAQSHLTEEQQAKISHLRPEELPLFLDTHFPEEPKDKKRVRGYRVKVKYGGV